MSDLTGTRSHQQQPQPHPAHQQPQPQQPLQHQHQQHALHHLHHYAQATSAPTPTPTAPTLGAPNTNKRFGVAAVLNSGHDAASYGANAPSADMYGSLYGQHHLKDRMAEFAFQQQYAGGPATSAEPSGQGQTQSNAAYYGSTYATHQQHQQIHSMGHDGLSFGMQDAQHHQQQQQQQHHQPQHSLGMPQLPEMQLPSHDTLKDNDGARKFRPLGGSMYMGSQSVYGNAGGVAAAGQGGDQRSQIASASESYMSSVRLFQSSHQQQQQQQQQQQSLGGYRSVMHGYSGAQAAPQSHGTAAYYGAQANRLGPQQHAGVNDLMSPAMAVPGAHGLRATSQAMGGRLSRDSTVPDNNTIRIQATQQSSQAAPAVQNVASINNQQQQQQQQQHQQQQPPQQQRQDLPCSFCYSGNCDRAAEGCGHVFHQNCLQAWGERPTTCPLCVGSSNVIKALTPTGVSYSQASVQQQMQSQVGMQQGYQGAAPLDMAGGRGPHDLPQSVGPSSGSGSVGRQRPRVQQRPPPIDTTRDAMPIGKINAGGAATVSTPGGQTTPSSESVSRPTSATSSSGSVEGGKRSSRSKGKKPLKECSIPGCGRTVRSRGLCKGHGGGRRCGFPGCGLSDQGGGFCISHGGGKRCQYDGCENSAQSRGLCKLHGGGSRCTVPNCSKSSQGRGLCRAHGGGRRCMIEGCNKTDRRAGYCVTHGADKKCMVPECSKTGRIDGMCTKHYFERNQAMIASQAQHATMVASANSKAAREETKNAKKKAAAAKAGAARSKMSQLTPATSPTTPSLLTSLNAVTLLSSASSASGGDVVSGMGI